MELGRVMRLISWIIMVPLGAAAIVFSISNRSMVVIDLWPAPVTLDVPLYAIVFASLFAGFLLGGIVSWFSAGKTRRNARASAARARTAERELEYTRAKAEENADPAPARGEPVLPPPL